MIFHLKKQRLQKYHIHVVKNPYLVFNFFLIRHLCLNDIGFGVVPIMNTKKMCV